MSLRIVKVKSIFSLKFVSFVNMTPIKQAFYPIYIAIIYKLCTSCQRKTDLYEGKIGSSWIPRIFLVPREEFSFFPRSSRGIKNRGKYKA